MKILIVDDDRDLTELLGFVLHRAAFHVVVAHDPGTALDLLENERLSLVLLDARLGTANGFDLLRDIRRSYTVPVIMLTAMAREDDKVLAFQLGADDYVTKPFSHRELIARIRARLRDPRSAPANLDGLPAQVQLGSLNLNARDYAAARDGLALKLTATEFRLLHCLLGHAGSVVPTAVILNAVWGYDDPGVRDSLRVTVYRLRRKIEDDPRNPQYLQTVAGVGFVLKPPPAATSESDSTSSAGGAHGMPSHQDAGATARVIRQRVGPRRGLKRPPTTTSAHSAPAESSSLERRVVTRI